MKHIKPLICTFFGVTSFACAEEAAVKEAPVVEDSVMTVSKDAVSLFDGETLTGWKPVEGDEKFWSVKDGILSGGDLENPVPRNVWLISDKEYENFELTFSVQFIDGGGPGLKNSGVQVRSLEINSTVCGYQIDAGPTHPEREINDGLGYWGNIWDEHRRGPLVTAENQDKLSESVKQFDGWNDYKVICNGTNIKTWINGVLAHDYTEKETEIIAANGILALQAHSGGKFLVQFKDVAIHELPATEGSTKWTDDGVLKGRVKKKKAGKKKKK